MSRMILLKAVLTKIIYFNEENYFIIGIFKDLETRKNFTAKGRLPEPSPGSPYELYGQTVVNEKYGKQFDFKRAEISEDAVNSKIYNILFSNHFKGIGKKVREHLYEDFGDEIIEILQRDDRGLDSLSYLKAKTRKNLVEKARELESQESRLKLFALGLGEKEIQNLENFYGKAQVMAVLKEDCFDPYYRCHGIGYQTALHLADALELDYQDERRQRGLVYSLIEKRIFSNGSTYIPLDLFYKEASYLSKETIDRSLVVLKEKGVLLVENERIYPIKLYEDEKLIAKKIRKHDFHVDPIARVELEGLLSDVEEELGIAYDEIQKEAIFEFFANPMLIINGGPGTGKSTIVEGILHILKKLKDTQKIALAAPTGRAAKRLSQITGVEASTIHSLLKWNMEKDVFQKGESDPLDIDFIILDECSMIDTHLFARLLCALPAHCRLVMIGDESQLESVSPGKVFKDLIDCGHIKVISLQNVYRTREGSQIARLASQIRKEEPMAFEGEVSFYNLEDGDILLSLQSMLKEKNVEEMQLLAPMYAGLAGINEINAMMQEAYNPFSPQKNELVVRKIHFREGDKILLKKNLPSSNVYNGDLGQISKIDVKNKEITVNFDGNEVPFHEDIPDYLVHGWCISVHKSQGSEYQDVFCIFPKEAAHMLSKKLLYTAISRAKRSLCILGSSNIFLQGVRKKRKNTRLTQLKERIEEQYDLYEQKQQFKEVLEEDLPLIKLSKKESAEIEEILDEAYLQKEKENIFLPGKEEEVDIFGSKEEGEEFEQAETRQIESKPESNLKKREKLEEDQPLFPLSRNESARIEDIFEEVCSQLEACFQPKETLFLSDRDKDDNDIFGSKEEKELELEEAQGAGKPEIKVRKMKKPRHKSEGHLV